MKRRWLGAFKRLWHFYQSDLFQYLIAISYVLSHSEQTLINPLAFLKSDKLMCLCVEEKKMSTLPDAPSLPEGTPIAIVSYSFTSEQKTCKINCLEILELVTSIEPATVLPFALRECL